MSLAVRPAPRKVSHPGPILTQCSEPTSPWMLLWLPCFLTFHQLSGSPSPGQRQCCVLCLWVRSASPWIQNSCFYFRLPFVCSGPCLWWALNTSSPTDGWHAGQDHGQLKKSDTWFDCRREKTRNRWNVKCWKNLQGRTGHGNRRTHIFKEAMGPQAVGASALLPMNSVSIQSRGPRDLESVAYP